MQQDLKEALQMILKQNLPNGLMPYAQEYTRACLELGDSDKNAKTIINEDILAIMIKRTPTGKEMVGEELKIQLLYVLCNLVGWRGEQARKVKEIIKKYSE